MISPSVGSSRRFPDESFVSDCSTLCSPLTLCPFKNGIRVPLGKILNPNNGLNCYSQFFEAVHVAYGYNLQVDNVVN